MVSKTSTRNRFQSGNRSMFNVTRLQRRRRRTTNLLADYCIVSAAIRVLPVDGVPTTEQTRPSLASHLASRKKDVIFFSKACRKHARHIYVCECVYSGCRGLPLSSTVFTTSSRKIIGKLRFHRRFIVSRNNRAGLFRLLLLLFLLNLLYLYHSLFSLFLFLPFSCRLIDYR